MKELKDYLHLYLGCEVEWWNGEGNYILDTYYLAEIDEDNLWEKTKPILRPLSDMTEEEHFKVAELLGYPKPYKFYDKQFFKWFWEGEGHEMYFAPAHHVEVFRYLLSIGIDLFDLIEAGLAIDKTKTQSL